jgi:histidyl-tRNA synthetase
MVLIPEVTQYIRKLGSNYLGKSKIYYIARCFRKELSTSANRLREFTQIGVEYLGNNALDCCRDARKDALWLFKQLKDNNDGWKLIDGAERGLNLYSNSNKTFEIVSDSGVQLLGGGPYEGGAGWAIGLERFMNDGNLKIP